MKSTDHLWIKKEDAVIKTQDGFVVINQVKLIVNVNQMSDQSTLSGHLANQIFKVESNHIKINFNDS